MKRASLARQGRYSTLCFVPPAPSNAATRGAAAKAAARASTAALYVTVDPIAACSTAQHHHRRSLCRCRAADGDGETSPSSSSRSSSPPSDPSQVSGKVRYAASSGCISTRLAKQNTLPPPSHRRRPLIYLLSLAVGEIYRIFQSGRSKRSLAEHQVGRAKTAWAKFARQQHPGQTPQP